MDHSPWFLPVGAHSIIAKASTVGLRYPGGRAAFEEAFQPIRKNDLRYLLFAFTQDTLDRLLERLADAGLAPGQDVALADEFCRPLQGCPELLFAFQGQGRCRVFADLPRLGAEGLQHGFKPVDRSGQVHAVLFGPEVGLAIAHRVDPEAARRADQYLCCFGTWWGFELGVFRLGWLGQFEVVGTGRTAQMVDGSDAMVRGALMTLGWPQEATDNVKGAISYLQEVVVHTIR